MARPDTDAEGILKKRVLDDFRRCRKDSRQRSEHEIQFAAQECREQMIVETFDQGDRQRAMLFQENLHHLGHEFDGE